MNTHDLTLIPTEALITRSIELDNRDNRYGCCGPETCTLDSQFEIENELATR